MFSFDPKTESSGLDSLQLDTRSQQTKEDYQLVRRGLTMVYGGGDELSLALQKDLSRATEGTVSLEGDLSKEDILAFQKKFGVEPQDGILGPITLRALDAALGRDLPVIASDVKLADRPIEYKLSDKEFAEAVAYSKGAQIGVPEHLSFLPEGTDVGVISRYFEVGNRGAGTVADNAGDYGGASFGFYQLSSTTGSVQDFIKWSGYSNQFKGMNPSDPSFKSTWQRLGANEENFAMAQHKYMEEKFFNPGMGKLYAMGTDLSKAKHWTGSEQMAVKNYAASTFNQHGVSGGSKTIHQATRHLDLSTASANDFITAIGEYKLSKVQQHFRSSSASIQASVAKRIPREMNMVLQMAAEKRPSELEQLSSPKLTKTA